MRYIYVRSKADGRARLFKRRATKTKKIQKNLKINKKLSNRRGTARCAMFVNSCYISRSMEVRKVSNSKSDFQGHSRASQYLSELCVPVADVAGRRQLRSASRGLLYFLRYNMSNYGRRAFSYAGPHAWNLPAENVRKSGNRRL